MADTALVTYKSSLTRWLNRLVSGALYPLEYVLTRRACEEDCHVCFIVGPPRSGSTLLYELLVTQFHCAYFSNAAVRLFRVPVAATTLFRRSMQERKGSYQSRYGAISGLSAPAEAGRIWRHWMPCHGPYLLKGKGLAEVDMRRKFAAMGRSLQGPMIVKYPHLLAEIPLLSRVFPKAVFIHLERDWIENARSVLQGISDKPTHSDSGWWSTKPLGWEGFADADPVVQSCAQVLLCHRQVRENLLELGEARSMHIQYEDICTAPEETLDRIGTFFAAAGMSIRRKNGDAHALAFPKPRKPDEETRLRFESALQGVIEVLEM